MTASERLIEEEELNYASLWWQFQLRQTGRMHKDIFTRSGCGKWIQKAFVIENKQLIHVRQQDTGPPPIVCLHHHHHQIFLYLNKKYPLCHKRRGDLQKQWDTI